MTNKERLISLIGCAPPANSVEGALLDVGIDAAGVYVAGNLIAIKTALVAVLELLLSTADTQQGTGQTSFSATYDRKALQERINLLKDELGITAGRPTVKGVNVW